MTFNSDIVFIDYFVTENALAALTAHVLEALLLTVRLFIYYFYQENREEYLLRKYAITPRDYIQKMIQAGFANLSTFGMSIAGLIFKSSVFLSAMSPTAYSILFGFIGYLAARWITGLLACKIRSIKTSYAFSHNLIFIHLVFIDIKQKHNLKVKVTILLNVWFIKYLLETISTFYSYIFINKIFLLIIMISFQT